MKRDSTDSLECMSILQPGQFGAEDVLPASHVIANWRPGDGGIRGESHEETWKRKSAESDTRNWNGTEMQGEKPPLSIRESVARDGFKYPVTVQHPSKAVDGPPRIFDGHHRLAVASEMGMSVPVRYAESSTEAHQMRRADDQAARAARKNR